MRLMINGEERFFIEPMTITTVLSYLGIDPSKVAIERNLEIVPHSAYSEVILTEGDCIEIVHFIGGGAPDILAQQSSNDSFNLAGRQFRSRLLVGTGKYRNPSEAARAIVASGAEIITVAVRRVELSDLTKPMVIDYLDTKSYTYLPNTAGCYTAREAIRTLQLARDAGGWELVKLEVIGDQRTLYPNMLETLHAAEQLIKDGFKVMVYCNDDIIIARHLEEMGCVAIMPLAAPIGSGLGVRNPFNIQLIVEQVKVPVLVDAGIGTASDATIAMELGCDGVLMNSAIAEARDPMRMAKAMRQAVEAGRLAYLAGRMSCRLYAEASSPLVGLINKDVREIYH